MFNPTNLNDILTIQASDLLLLPSAEDDRYEYKSSATKDPELAEKIARAASGFWNSGGGLFVAGVDGQGKPDGGLTLKVGRQSRRDWIDQVISRVAPQSFYIVHSVEENKTGLNIAPENAVFLIGFGESEIGPHMAADNRYYLRAGAHTVPASHFLVEAIHARRGLKNPFLRHILRRKPGNSRIIQLGIINLSIVPAINVSIELNPLPTLLDAWSSEKFPLQVPIISEQFPFFFDIEQIGIGDNVKPIFHLILRFSDVAKREYSHIFEVDIDGQIGPNLSSEKGNEGIEKELDEVKKAIVKIADTIKNKK